MRVLVVEDDKNLSSVIIRGLKEEGYSVDLSLDGEDGLYLAQITPYDLIILDWMLPNLSGPQICEQLRNQGKTTPILLLTAKGTISDRVDGLDSGADDYLVKPFAFDELLARLRALTRRQSPTRSNRLKIGDLTIDVRTHLVQKKGQEIQLTAKEFALLEYFMRHPGVILSRQEIEEHIWNYDYASESNLIDVYIRRLRRKLDDPFEIKLFETVKGVGYRLRKVGESDV